MCRTAGGFDQHRRSHGIEPTAGNLACFVCEKRYRSASGFMYHKRNVQGSLVASRLYDAKAARKAASVLQSCPHCVDRLHTKDLEAHFLGCHSDKFDFVTCKLCTATVRLELAKAHVKHHNGGGGGGGVYFLREEEHSELFALSLGEIIDKFVRDVKSQLDFEYLGDTFFHDNQLCRLCSSDVRGYGLKDHLTSHNRKSDRDTTLR